MLMRSDTVRAMSLFAKSTPERSSFYLGKCQDHLRRARASYELAVRGLEAASMEALDEHLRDGAQGGDTRAKMKEVLVRSHFLLLKVNFELFLQLLALDAWRVALRERRRGNKVPDAIEKRLRDTALVGTAVMEHADSIEAICSAIVPAHGLDKLRGLLAEAGLDVRQTWNAANHRIWAQINTAFAVRHLIEHRNGKIDQRFRELVEPTWKASSWGKRGDVLLADGRRVEVLEGDLGETQAMMSSALDALDAPVRELDARYAATALE